MLSKLLKLNVAGEGCKLRVQVNPIQTREAFGGEPLGGGGGGGAFGGAPLSSPPPPPPARRKRKKARSEVQTDVTTPIIVGPTMLRVVTFVVAVVCKRIVSSKKEG